MQTSSKKNHPVARIVLAIVAVAIIFSVAFRFFQKSSFVKAFKGGFALSSCNFTSAYCYANDADEESYFLFASNVNVVCYVPAGSKSAFLSSYSGSNLETGLSSTFYYPKETDHISFRYQFPHDDSVLAASISTDKITYSPLLYEKVDAELAKEILDSKSATYLVNSNG